MNVPLYMGVSHLKRDIHFRSVFTKGEVLLVFSNVIVIVLVWLKKHSVTKICSDLSLFE